MKYYKLFAILILAGMMACSGEKKEKGSEESVETVLPVLHGWHFHCIFLPLCLWYAPLSIWWR